MDNASAIVACFNGCSGRALRVLLSKDGLGNTFSCHHDSIDPPNELRNRIHLRNLALVHVALIISLMQRVAGSTVTNDRQHGARGGMYGAHEHYVQPYPVTNF